MVYNLNKKAIKLDDYVGFYGTSRLSHRGAFLRRPVVKDSRNEEFYDIADTVYNDVYKEHFDDVVVK